jgi:hypothetical protein
VANQRVQPVGRDVYVASGGLRPLPFFALSLVLFAAAGVMAVALAMLYWSGWYLIGLAAALAALPLAGICFLAVTVGHCRSRAAVVVVGIIATLICYLGYYHVDLLGTVGARHLLRVDLLPQYIAWRMNNDVIEDVGKQQPNNPPPGDLGKIIFNWVFFALDFAFIGGLTIAAGWVAAGKPYDEEREQWLAQTTIHLPAGSGRGLLGSLNAGNLAALQAELQASGEAASPHCAVALYHAKEGLRDGPLATPPVASYLAVAEVSPAAGNKTPQRHELALFWRLSDDEFAIFRDRCLTVVPLPPVPSPTLVDGGKTAAAEAYVEPVPAPYAGVALNPATNRMATAIGLTPIIAFLVACIGCGVAAYLSNTPAMMVLFIAAATVVGISGILFTIWFADYLPSRCLYRVLCRELELRPGKLVHVNDAGVEVIQVVPRSHWSQVMLEDAADVGLLMIDRQRQMILFEGDHERWVIPAASIQSCEVVDYVPGQGQTTANGLRFYLAALQVNVGGKLWEACITRRQISFQRRTTKVRQRDAQELRAKILALRE